MKQILIYDVNVIPTRAGINGQEVIEFYMEHQVVLWDSSEATEGQDCKPQVINIEESSEMNIIDYQTIKDFKDLKKVLSECIDKELIKEMIEFANKKPEE